MDAIDTEKIDEAALALLVLTLGDDDRAWKGMDWEVSARLHAKGMIYDPRNKAKSLHLTPKGRDEAERLFFKLFAKVPD